MKVFRVATSHGYQRMLPTDESFWERGFEFSGEEVGARWNPLGVYVLHPKHKAGDFYRFTTGVFIVNERVRTLAATPLEMAAELLPVVCEGRSDNPYYLVNVIECIDVLDRKKSRWEDDDEALAIEHFAFHTNRFTESSLFRIPDTPELFALEQDGDPENEFKALVEKHSLQGLDFQEVWST